MRTGRGQLVRRPLLDEATAALNHFLLPLRLYFEADRVDEQIIELGVYDVLHHELIEVRQDRCTELLELFGLEVRVGELTVALGSSPA